MRTDADAVVVGSGPAGAVAALVLARGGARVVLVDKTAFPRDKACGDLVGPRAVRLLTELGLVPPMDVVSAGDMEVVGPTGGRTLLRAREGRTYPGAGWAVPRLAFDTWLRDAALAAGAVPLQARVAGLEADPDRPEGRGDAPVTLHLDGGGALRADVVVGADGATSAVARSAGLVAEERVLWGFALRVYLDVPVERPAVVMWDPRRGRSFPGYGWLFPGPEGRANAGLGVGAGADRRRGTAAARQLGAFLAHLHELGLTAGGARGTGGQPSPLGGWLKMGMVGTTPARGLVLLAGDAAGLVNPLQGEGVTQAVDTGAAAARAVLAGPSTAAATYRAHLRSHHAGFQAAAACLHSLLLAHPRAASHVGRALTTSAVGRLLGPGWALYWNDLADGASPGPGQRVAAAADRLARLATARSAPRRWLEDALAPQALPG